MITACLAGVLVWGPVLAQSPLTGEPPNTPAGLDASGPRVTLTYEGRAIASGTIGDATATAPELRTVTGESNGAVTEVIKWTALKCKHCGHVRGEPLVVRPDFATRLIKGVAFAIAVSIAFRWIVNGNPPW